MKHKISELEGALLDAAVAKAEGRMPWHGWVSPGRACTELPLRGQFEEYSSDWRNGGPIIEREHISIVAFALEDEPPMWRAFTTLFSHYIDEPLPGYSMRKVGPTALIAAMRAYIASKFGEEVELP